MSKAGLPFESESIPASRGLVAVGTFLALALGSGLAVVASSSDNAPLDSRRLAFVYLTALMFLTSIGVGALAWVMLHHISGAVWSVAVRRLLECLSRGLPWLAVFYLPVALNLPRIYLWADPARVAADPGLARKAAWLNPVAFNARAFVYLGSWALLSGLLARASARQDRGDPSASRSMKTISIRGLIVLGVTTSLAAFDWMMSLDPHWSSTIFGVYFWAGSLLAGLAALALMALALNFAGWLRSIITVDHRHDLGKLLFGFVIFWAYIAFCQYFLIWYANLPEETQWYITRRSGVWNTVSWSLLFGQFAAPFCLLLPRATKRSPFWLGFVAAWILVFHYVDFYWLIMPALGQERFQPQWTDAAVAVCVVSLGAAIVAGACIRRPLIPIGDPLLADSLAYRNP